jgi:phosphatidate cytidylyltransferase
MNIFLLVGITLILSLIGQCGDLLFSSVKRYYGKKDYSDIIPGHGGILDRLDSIIFVILVFAIVMQII